MVSVLLQKTIFNVMIELSTIITLDGPATPKPGTLKSPARPTRVRRIGRKMAIIMTGGGGGETRRTWHIVQHV